jgi:predicted RNA-binding protein YlxR (DUF448 family)
MHPFRRGGPRDALIRLAISPEGPDGACFIAPDALAKAPGRGAWIGVRADELKGDCQGQAEGRSGAGLKGAKIAIPDDLPEKIEAALTRAFTDRLGLEMRSGRCWWARIALLKMRDGARRMAGPCGRCGR